MLKDIVKEARNYTFVCGVLIGGLSVIHPATTFLDELGRLRHSKIEDDGGKYVKNTASYAKKKISEYEKENPLMKTVDLGRYLADVYFLNRK